MNYEKVIKEKIAPGVDLKGKIVMYEAQCPECQYKVASYSQDLVLCALSKHMEVDHREQLLALIKAFDNIDQVLIDLLLDPPRKFNKQVFGSYLNVVAVAREDWMLLPDLVQVK